MEMDEALSEAIGLMSGTTQEHIANAMAMAFNSPEPPVTAQDVASLLEAIRSPDVQGWAESLEYDMRRWLCNQPKYHEPVTYQQVYKTLPDGTQLAFQIRQLPPLRGMPFKALERALLYDQAAMLLGEHQAQKVMGALSRNKLARLLEEQQRVMEAARKIGIPEKAGDLQAGKVDASDCLKAMLTRQAVKTAVVNGVWINALLTADRRD